MQPLDLMEIGENSPEEYLVSATRHLKDTNLLDLGRQLLNEAKYGNSDKVKLLVSAGAPFTADWVGTSPIHWTAHYNHIDVTELLLRSGISADARNKVDRTPLHVACQNGHVEIVSMLIAFGADLNARDMLRMAPLHWAALSGNKAIVKMLLEHGAAIQSFSKFGKTPLDVAEDHSHYDIVKMIEEAKATPLQDRIVKVAHKRKESSLSAQKIRVVDNPNHLLSNGNGDVLKMVAKRRKIVIDKRNENLTTKIQAIVKTEDKPKIVLPQSNGFAATNNTEQAIQMLKDHGITMLEPDNGTVVSSAVERGQSIKLTEAGKLALSSVKLIPSKTNTVTTPTATLAPGSLLSSKSPVKFLPNGQKIITIKADQLINMTKERRVIIKQARPVPNARIFDGKLYTTSQKDELAAKIKEKRTEALNSINEKKKSFDEEKKCMEESKERMIKIQKEMDELNKQVFNFDRTLAIISPVITKTEK